MTTQQKYAEKQTVLNFVAKIDLFHFGLAAFTKQGRNESHNFDFGFWGGPILIAHQRMTENHVVHNLKLVVDKLDPSPN